MVIPLLMLLAAEPAGYYLPEPLVFKGYEAYYQSNPDLIMPWFFPIGWSGDGKFACLYAFDDYGDAYGYIDLRLVIKDCRNDSTIAELSVPQETYATGTQFIMIWRDFRPRFTELLRQHGIVQAVPVVEPFPLKVGRDTIGCAVDTSYFPPDQDPLAGTLDSIAVRLAVRNRGSKLIYERHGQEGMGVGMGCDILGGLLDPGRRYLVTLVGITYWGWEGPPSTCGIMICGIDLRAAFPPSR